LRRSFLLAISLPQRTPLSLCLSSARRSGLALLSASPGVTGFFLGFGTGFVGATGFAFVFDTDLAATTGFVCVFDTDLAATTSFVFVFDTGFVGKTRFVFLTAFVGTAFVDTARFAFRARFVGTTDRIVRFGFAPLTGFAGSKTGDLAGTELRFVPGARFNRSRQFVERYLAVDVTLRNCHRLSVDIQSLEMQRFKSAHNTVSTLSPVPVFS
jgi:hypothetical protein